MSSLFHDANNRAKQLQLLMAGQILLILKVVLLNALLKGILRKVANVIRATTSFISHAIDAKSAEAV